MKYLTKKWYNKMTNMNMYLKLKVTREAEVFSEDYFNNLYNGKDKERYEFRLKKLYDFLPKDIIDIVPDMRVLALNYTSKEVKDKIEDYCKKVKKEVDKTLKDCYDNYKNEFKDNEPDFLDELNLHDYIVKSCKKEKNNIVLEVEYNYDVKDIKRVILKDYEVIKEEHNMGGAFFLYHEIYKNKDGYELHFLLSKNGLFEFTVLVSDVEIEK